MFGFWASMAKALTAMGAAGGRISGQLSHVVSKRPIWLAEAADWVIARSPTTQRSPDRGTAGQRRSHPHSHRAVRISIAATSRPVGGGRSCRARNGKHVAADVRQAQRVIQLAIRQQPATGGDDAATKLEYQAAVETSRGELNPHRLPDALTISPCLLTTRITHRNQARQPQLPGKPGSPPTSRTAARSKRPPPWQTMRRRALRSSTIAGAKRSASMRSSGSRSDGGLLWHRKLAFWMVVPIENPLEHLFLKQHQGRTPRFSWVLDGR